MSQRPSLVDYDEVVERFDPVLGLEVHVELNAQQDVLRLPHRRSAPSPTPRSAPRAWACPARCRW